MAERINLPALLRPFFESPAAQAYYRVNAPAILDEALSILSAADDQIAPTDVCRLVECLLPTSGLRSTFHADGGLQSMLELARAQMRRLQ